MTAARRRRRRTGPLLAWLLFFAVAGAGAGYWWVDQLPNTEKTTPSYMNKLHPVMRGGEWTEAHALGEGEDIKIPLSLAEELFGEGIWYEEATDSIVLTTAKSVLHFKTGELDATLNRKPFELRFAAVKADETLYLPLAPLVELFGLRAETDPHTGIVTLLEPGTAVQRAEVPGDRDAAALRVGPDKDEPIVEELPPGAPLRIWGETQGWYRAQSASGHIGYLRKKDASLQAVEQVPADAETADDELFVPWKLTGQRINLTWEAVYSANPDPAKIGGLSGVNVVSPTWFELLDGEGKIRSKADARYVTWAHNKGMQVWGLFSNSFEPERTTQALSSYESRLRMIQQLLAYAKTYRLQGINIDFENVVTADKEPLVQFVRELTPLLHEQGLVVSIDVTPKSNSEMWSAFLDREKLGKIVDFMMVMTYDEHWASSPVAGSVSSLPWAESSIVRILKEDHVPPEKLLLGIPLYTRLWTEDENGKVSSKALGMDAVAKLIQERGLKPVFSEETGQHYVEFKEGKETKKIWIEDETSIRARAELAKKYNLAGVATWQRQFAADAVWDVLDRTLQSRP